MLTRLSTRGSQPDLPFHTYGVLSSQKQNNFIHKQKTVNSQIVGLVTKKMLFEKPRHTSAKNVLKFRFYIQIVNRPACIMICPKLPGKILTVTLPKERFSDWSEWARTAQSVVCWAHCPAWCSVTGSILLWASGRGDFSLGVNMVSGSIPPNSFRWEYKLRSSLCTHAFHRTDSKDPDIHVLDGWMPATKHIQHAPSMKTECDYLYGWIKIRSHTQKSHPRWWTLEIQLGTQKKKADLKAVWEQGSLM